jgi:phage portal protein BeeE
MPACHGSPFQWESLQNAYSEGRVNENGLPRRLCHPNAEMNPKVFRQALYVAVIARISP